MFGLRSLLFARPAIRAYSTEAASPAAGGLILNFALPHQAVYTGANVKQVILPSASGEMGVLAHHVPVITELKPGVVTVIGNDESASKLFISGGFAVMDDKSNLNISTTEAFPLDDLDAQVAKTEFDRYSQQLVDAVASGNLDAEAEASIALDVYKSMLVALGSTH